ncbi:MAG TPA: hypothetical protein VFU59_02465 [Candidatus Eisenbacteria bacterium]|nr:hypothetical protein [Candidatus Eisenbacteria bacterium]
MRAGVRSAAGVALVALTLVAAATAKATGGETGAAAKPRVGPPVAGASAGRGIGAGGALGAEPLSLGGSRPFHGSLDAIAWGGHGEIRLGHDRTRGTSDPEWFSIGRVNGFAQARLARRWRLAGEGTWDRGTDDFAMERIELAFRWKPTLLAHGGVFPLPLGRTNLEHDAPKNEFAEHSLVATQLVGVPNAMLGVGVRGAAGAARRTVYELDVVTGFSDGLLMDAAGGTRLPAGRNNYGDQNGLPSLVGRVAFRGAKGSEWGVAAQSGPYNQTKIGGVTVDDRRWVHLVVADGVTTVAGFEVAAEAGVAFIDIPPGLLGLYAQDQWGASVEATRAIGDPLFKRWAHTALRVAVRADAVDFDRGLLGDSRHRVSASLNLHRRPYAVARLGWYYEIQRDRFDNDTPKAGVTFTAASYF